ncbi:MAG: peptidase M23, partial [Proteobacteria bacterium]|nr:peptidase M23 [Pseudomonadota bacterium]
MPTLRTWSGPVAAVVLAVLTGVAAAPHAFAGIDEVDQKLESVERALEQERAQGERLESSAAALAREVAGLRADLIEAAHASQNYEEHVTALEVRLAGLAREDADKSATLRRRRATLAATLGALQRLSRQPPEALIAAPAAIDDTIRTSLLLGAVVPLLDDEARRLRAELDALTRLRREIATERLELAAATD